MGRSRRDERDYSREQKLIKENKQLKQTISKLRKQINRLDLDRYTNIKELIEEHYQDSDTNDGIELLEKLKKDWKCYECHEGYLEIIKYTKRDGEYYYRTCTSCNKRTKSQKYTETVKGIKSNQSNT